MRQRPTYTVVPIYRRGYGLLVRRWGIRRTTSPTQKIIRSFRYRLQAFRWARDRGRFVFVYNSLGEVQFTAVGDKR